ncbi:carotenoid 1,2-hydratase [Deinococcus sp. HMF7604]|uniref:lipocalin family protein n=1 Tax=Deinococcus betulae TaxID=2873312 RepID=UPI001CCBC36B|nr:lipocalin family protein [Deinococcus betulae]MBZ9751598.1 carotenoid 1,2-hydratase [Deinococcus betulae]
MKRLLLLLTAALLGACTPVQLAVDPAARPSPADYGPHNFPMEWWYVSAYLPSEALALHWAQFRVRDTRLPVPLMISHVAVTDLKSGSLSFLEQPAGGGEASFPPLRLSQQGWTFQQQGTSSTAPFELKAGPLDLTLTPLKGPVIHPPGYSGGPEVGALYYQSVTWLALSGTVNGRPVQGQAWLDHQWGNQIPGQTALWDWFSVHLEGGDDLMVYRVRRPDGEVAQLIGSVVDPSGQVRAVTGLRATPGATWTSLAGHTYALGWHLQADDFDLTVRALRREQELRSRSNRIDYWEGPIEVQGTWASQPTRGTGMMELVGGPQRSSGGAALQMERGRVKGT